MNNSNIMINEGKNTGTITPTKAINTIPANILPNNRKVKERIFENSEIVSKNTDDEVHKAEEGFLEYSAGVEELAEISEPLGLHPDDLRHQHRDQRQGCGEIQISGKTACKWDDHVSAFCYSVWLVTVNQLPPMRYCSVSASFDLFNQSNGFKTWDQLEQVGEQDDDHDGRKPWEDFLRPFSGSGFSEVVEHFDEHFHNRQKTLWRSGRLV